MTHEKETRAIEESDEQEGLSGSSVESVDVHNPPADAGRRALLKSIGAGAALASAAAGGVLVGGGTAEAQAPVPGGPQGEALKNPYGGGCGDGGRFQDKVVRGRLVLRIGAHESTVREAEQWLCGRCPEGKICQPGLLLQLNIWQTAQRSRHCV